MKQFNFLQELLNAIKPVAKKKMPQRYRVLEYMEKYGGITGEEARLHLTVHRLPSRIHELKKEGNQIYKVWIKGSGSGVKFARYRLGVKDEI